jgi:glycosyltransferase involved in cell wall biosynthesis
MVDLTVVMCVYDENPRVVNAIRSVSAQSLDANRYELVVVDDGSTDGTVDLVKRTVDDARYETTILQNERNRGLVASANRGIGAASGTYVVRLDGDDSFAPTALETLLKAALSTQSDLVYSDRYELDVTTNQVTYVEALHEELFSLVAAGTLMKHDILTEISGYRNLFWEEYDLYIRFLQESSTDPVYVSQPLMVYAQHEESMTADDKRVRDGWDELVTEWGKETLSKYGTLPSYISDNES